MDQLGVDSRGSEKAPPFCWVTRVFRINTNLGKPSRAAAEAWHTHVTRPKTEHPHDMLYKKWENKSICTQHKLKLNYCIFIKTNVKI